MRTIKFRGKTESGNWSYGDLAHHDNLVSIINQSKKDGSMIIDTIDPETMGQFTGIKDKKGNEIYEGDIVIYRRAVRRTQTHDLDYGTFYTEPMEPEIEDMIWEIRYRGGAFIVMNEDYWEEMYFILDEQHNTLTIEDVKKDIDYGDLYERYPDLFEGEGGDLEYLLEEYKLESVDELLDLLQGMEVIGNIHDNPELLEEIV